MNISKVFSLLLIANAFLQFAVAQSAGASPFDTTVYR